MNNKENKKPLFERLSDVNILGDGNLFNIKPSDVIIKSFESEFNQETPEEEQNDVIYYDE